ncbi:MAG: LPS-assembly protein [Candidatus Azotimanducaceae bacterium]|jgi:LPS-assembly protein
MYGMKYTLITLLVSSFVSCMGLQAQISDSQICDPMAANGCSHASVTVPVGTNSFALFEDLAASTYLPSLAPNSDLDAVAHQCAGGYQIAALEALPIALRTPSGEEILRANLNQLSGQVDGDLRLQGNVSIEYGQRRLATSLATIDLPNQMLVFPQGVRISQPNLLVQGDRAEMATGLGTVALEGVQMVFADVGLRGKGVSMSQSADGSMLLKQGEFTRCAPNNNGWSLQTKSLEIKDGDVFATTRGTVLKIKSVPVFYAPYLRVPVNDQRQSGLLTPAIGYSSEDGLDLAVPYYLNLAPNLDATIVPRVMTQRGVGLEGELRYLSPRQQSAVDLALLPSDDLYNGVIDRSTFQALNDVQGGGVNLPDNFAPADRWLAAVDHFGQFGSVQTRVDFSRVSDRDYFRDIDSNLGVANPIDLQRFAQVAFISPKLQVRLMSQGFQRLDELNTESYERAPQLLMNYQSPLGNSLATFGLNAQWADFQRGTTGLTGLASAEGSRLHIEPSVRVGQHKSAGFWAAEAGYRYSQYQLDYADPLFAESVADTDPSREVAYLSVDAGLFFDRQYNFAGLEGTQTLEPRIYYLRQGYEDQDTLPIFDSTSIALDYAQLFRSNRFVGLDRIGDADQITLGVTSRFLSAADGRELFSVSLGQIEQFSDPRVSLANNPLANSLPESSALAGEISAHLSPHWQVIANEVWDYEQSQWQELGATVRYRGDNKHLFNLGFRRRAQEDIEQAELSFFWPLSHKLGVMARWHYDIGDDRTLEGFAGLEYDDCCLRVRLMLRQYLDNPAFAGQLQGNNQSPFLADDLLRKDRSVYLQVVFKGLAGFGNKIDRILERGVRGYRPVSQ